MKMSTQIKLLIMIKGNTMTKVDEDSMSTPEQTLELLKTNVLVTIIN